MKYFNEILDNSDTDISKSKRLKITQKGNEFKNKLIVQHNHLIEARYRLNLQEKRIILWLLTQITINDEDFKLHRLEISEFSKMVGLKHKGQYQELQSITGNLMKRVIRIYEIEKQELIQVSWLSSARYQMKKGCVLLEFSPQLKPYLLQLKSHFTKLNLSDMMQFNSVYAMRFYELLKQYEYIGTRKIDIKDLREYCGISEEEYKRYNDLKKAVLERAKKEINEKTDLKIDYSEIKESRKIVAIEWSISKKDVQKQRHKEKIKILQKELRSSQIVIDNLMEYGFGKTIAKRMLTMHGEEIVANAIKAVNIQIEKGKVKNPKAMIKVAIEERWHPEIFKTKKSKPV